MEIVDFGIGYNTNDIENGVSTKECFHVILDLAYEKMGENAEESKMYFNILKSCLGIDFSVSYPINSDVLFNLNATDNALDSFEVYASDKVEDLLLNNKKELIKNGNKASITSEQDERKKLAHEEIDLIFNELPYMVKDGVFSKKYHKYLLNRKKTLAELIKYQHKYITAKEDRINDLEKDNDMSKELLNDSKTIMQLVDTRDKLIARIEEVEYNLNESLNNKTSKIRIKR